MAAKYDDEFERQVQKEMDRLRKEIGAYRRSSSDALNPNPTTSLEYPAPLSPFAPPPRAPSPLSYQAAVSQPDILRRRRDLDDVAPPPRRPTPPRQYNVGEGPLHRFVPDAVREATAAAWAAAAAQPRGRLPRKRRDEDIGPDPYGGGNRGVSADSRAYGGGGGGAEFFTGGGARSGGKKSSAAEQAAYAAELDRQVAEALRRKQQEKARREEEDAKILQEIQQQQQQPSQQQRLQRLEPKQPPALAVPEPPPYYAAPTPAYVDQQQQRRAAASPLPAAARATSPLPGAGRVGFAGNMDAETLHQRILEGQTFSR
jgi:hypothetical protein